MSLVSVHMPSSMLGFNDGTPGNNPTVTGITPPNISAAGGPVTITATGTNFVTGAKILVDGVPLTTTFVSATSLTASWDPTTQAPALFTIQNPNGEISAPIQYTSVQTLMAEPQQRTVAKAVPSEEDLMRFPAQAPESESEGTSGTSTPPTEVVPGDPGEFLPSHSEVPENISTLRELDLEMESLKPWKKGEHVVIGTGNVHWDGKDWAKGIA